MKAYLLAVCAGASLVTVSMAAEPAIKPYLAAALADSARGADIDIDARRKPGEIIAFSGLKPGDKAVDLIPGSGYFTKIFSKVVGPKGRVYMIWPNEYAREAHPDPENNQKLAQQPAFNNITVIEQPGAAFAAPEPVDLVFTSQNYHDYPDKFMGQIDPMVFDRAVYKALKPGGVFLVIDHVAEAGSGLRDTDTLHRIDPAIVKKQVTAAGFVYEGESEALRNPVDDHKKVVFDKSIRGHTDQFIYKFRKPKKAG
ncbi:MAG TPA: methyltransferase [Caulobacteraceae bacterium]|jgi:predicted methyltransferase